MPASDVRLIPFSPGHLLTLIEEPGRFRDGFGHPAADGLREFFASGDVSPGWLEALRSAAGVDPWRFGFAVVVDGSVVGAAGFKGAPDADGSVEIAYGIVPSHEGRGLATEAARGLVEYALADERVTRIRAHTLPERNASARVLEKNGFRWTGEVIDPEDGPVWRWERARHAPARPGRPVS